MAESAPVDAAKGKFSVKMRGGVKFAATERAKYDIILSGHKRRNDPPPAGERGGAEAAAKQMRWEGTSEERKRMDTEAV